MKKVLVGILIIGLIVIVGCGESTSSAVSGSGSDVVEPIVVNDEDDGHDEPGFARKIEVVAKKWEFIPDTISVKVGETVELHIESVDVKHGIMIPEFGINLDLEPRRDAHVLLTPEKAGEFPFFCSVPCGSGHSGMKGKIVVEQG